MPSVGATSGMSGTVASASLLKLQQQQQQQAAVQLQQQQPSVTAPQPPFNQVNYVISKNTILLVPLLKQFILFFSLHSYLLFYLTDSSR